jgi:hypothetical protein
VLTICNGGSRAFLRPRAGTRIAIGCIEERRRPVFDWLPERIRAVQRSAAAQQARWGFVLAPPAIEADLRGCEAALGRPLPPSYRAFLARWNGASLFRQEVRLPDGQVALGAEIGIQGAGDLPAFHQQVRDELRFHDAGDWGDLIVFCAIPGTGGDWCGLNPEHATATGEYAVVDCFHEMRPRCWRRAVAAPSFGAWLEQVFTAALQTGDPYFWINAPEVREAYRQCHEEDQRALAARQRPPGP